MRYVLILFMLLLLSPNPAAADHLGVFTDQTASNCNLAPGFTGTAVVMHKFTLGTTMSRFRLEFPAGSSFFAFNTPFVLVGSIQSDASVAYLQCLQVSVVVGTITAFLTEGILWVKPADGFSDVIVSDCAFVETSATCGAAYVGIPDPYCPTCQTVATDQTTWGAVKSLYR